MTRYIDQTPAIFTNPLTATDIAIRVAGHRNMMPRDIASARVKAYPYTRRGQRVGWVAMWRDSAGQNRPVTNDDADAVCAQ